MLLNVSLGAIFPATDPIPLPAPVWVFKVLHDLTLALHFVALFMLLGGLGLALLLNVRGHRAAHPPTLDASGKLAGWLPVLMTYVINLGIPPLLFAQVLYGRALYTSSVLLGAYWIAVIPLLIAGYHMLYVMKARSEAGRSFVWPALGSVVAICAIGRIYSANMTLMLEPSLWLETYQTTTSGTLFRSGPAGWLRFAYVLASGLVGASVLALWVSRQRALSAEAAAVLRRTYKGSAVLGAVAVLTIGLLTWANQPTGVREVCSSASVVWTLMVAVWFAGTVALVVVAALPSTPNGWQAPAFLSGGALLQVVGFTVARDRVRDATLQQYGFDVWDRAVVVNWSVLLLFLGLFVSGLVVVGWLALVGYRVADAKEQLS